MGRKMRKVELTAEEQATLRMRLREGKTEQRAVQRAKVILMSTEETSLKEISRKTGLSIYNCMKWRRRFFKSRLKGLKDKQRSGRPQELTSQQRVSVVALACTLPPDGINQWSIRKLAEATGFGSTTVHRILNEGKIKPHKINH